MRPEDPQSAAALGPLTARTRWLALGVVACAITALLLVEGRDQIFHGDEWDYAIRLSHQPLDQALLEPPSGKYLVAVPLLLYKGLFESVGISDYLPYRLIGIALVLTCSALLFAVVRRCVGDVVALLAGTLLAVYGSAAEVVVIPLRIPELIAVAAGLGMVLSLESFERGLTLPLDPGRERRADLVACVLLAVAMLSHPIGVAFAAAAIVYVCFRPKGDRVRSIWVFALPLAVFATWWLVYGSGRTDPAGAELADVLSFVAESFVACLAAATALIGLIEGSSYDSPLGWVAAVSLLILSGLAIASRRVPLSPGFWAALAALGVLWISEAIAPLQTNRTPETERYIYVGTLFLFLVLAQFAGSVELSGPGIWAVCAVLAVGIIWNVVELDRRAAGMRALSASLTSQLEAVDRARKPLPPDAPAFPASLSAAGVSGPITNPPAGAGGKGYYMRVGEYLRIKEAFGSPTE